MRQQSVLGKRCRVSLVMALAWCASLMAAISFAEDAGQDLKGPFYANLIEVFPGGKMMLHPRVYFEEGFPEKDYRLVLNLPWHIRLSPLQVVDTDDNAVVALQRLDSIAESSRKVVCNGARRIEFMFQPDLELAMGGAELAFCYRMTSDFAPKFTRYRPIMKFSGSYDWRIIEKEIYAPDWYLSMPHWYDAFLKYLPFGNLGKSDGNESSAKMEIKVIPLLVKWGQLDKGWSGGLFLRKMLIKDAATGQIVFDYKPETPVAFKFESGKLSAYWLTNANEKVTLAPGGKYLIQCEVRAENIQGPDMTCKERCATVPRYFRTMIFDVDPRAKFPEKMLWRIEDRRGRIYRSGELSLVPGVKPLAPKKLEASVWICESSLKNEIWRIQQLYLEKLRDWGLNAIEPEMKEPVYNAPLTDASLVMPIALEAKRLGLRVRSFLFFMYKAKNAENYLKVNPQFTAIDAQNRKTDLSTYGYPFICPTHCLEGEKHDIPAANTGAGQDNAWLGYYYQAIKKSVEINKLDGVFYDFEVSAAPYVKTRPGNKTRPANEPRKYTHACICERCRRAFQAYAGLDHVPSVEECCAEALYDKWVDFRCHQNAQLWQLTRQAAKAGNSKATFAIYSGGPGDYSRQAYGVDWGMAAPLIDFAMQRCEAVYPPQLTKNLEIALRAGLKENQTRPPVLIQLGVFPYINDFYVGNLDDANRHYRELPNIKNNIIRNVAESGSFGWSFNGIWGMDDQLIKPIREANALLAEYEDYFIKGRKLEDRVRILEKTGGVGAISWEQEGSVITFILNRSGNSQHVTLSDAKSAANVEISVPAHDCVVHQWNLPHRR
ncbi:MAG: hypothetical protein KJ964_11795 [Verrucomicrobia bacterium]|nr:hypothetical protein [Verrucomicrobiota bacterium]MBU1734494.1 hypothetical protein [Verrucomicrobiota bacterium]MBU1856464.1 hypothetical protein [Verrucomicrobiota bacterium]